MWTIPPDTLDPTPMPRKTSPAQLGYQPLARHPTASELSEGRRSALLTPLFTGYMAQCLAIGNVPPTLPSMSRPVASQNVDSGVEGEGRWEAHTGVLGAASLPALPVPGPGN